MRLSSGKGVGGEGVSWLTVVANQTKLTMYRFGISPILRHTGPFDSKHCGSLFNHLWASFQDYP